MDSTDDGFHSGAHDITGDEEPTRRSLLSREQELNLVCEQLGLSAASFGKTCQEKLGKYSRSLVEKGISDVSRAHLMECHARKVLRQDELKGQENDLELVRQRYCELVERAFYANSLLKKALKALQNATEENKKNLGRVQPFFLRPDDQGDIHGSIDHTADLVQRAASAMRVLSEMKLKLENNATVANIPIGANVLSELEDKTQELEQLNKRLEELGLQ